MKPILQQLKLTDLTRAILVLLQIMRTIKMGLIPPTIKQDCNLNFTLNFTKWGCTSTNLMIISISEQIKQQWDTMKGNSPCQDGTKYLLIFSIESIFLVPFQHIKCDKLYRILIKNILIG